MSKVDDIIEALVGREGGYSNDPDDSGGETNWGITKAVAEEEGYTGAMRDMTRDQAKAIYVSRYWTKSGFAAVSGTSLELAEELFDTGVNLGVDRASIFLQRCLNALNNRGTLYSDIEVDGDVGGRTLMSLARYNHSRDIKELIKAVDTLQGAFYIELTERREKDEKYLYGWLKHRVN